MEPQENDDGMMEQAMQERHQQMIEALHQCKDKGVDEDALATLCFECGVPYGTVFGA